LPGSPGAVIGVRLLWQSNTESFNYGDDAADCGVGPRGSPTSAKKCDAIGGRQRPVEAHSAAALEQGKGLAPIKCCYSGGKVG
jgi:hypothetical protein